MTERPLVAFRSLLEADFVEQLALESIDVRIDLAAADGSWRGVPVRIETSAYSSSRVRYARFVSITGGSLEIVNMLVVPAFELAAPMFGADLVSLREDSTLLVCDLVPTARDGAHARAQHELSRRVDASSPRFPDAGELPAWAARWFSPTPMHARVDRETLADSLEVVRARARAFVDYVVSTARDEGVRSATRDAVCEYCSAHRADDRSLELIARMFGRHWSDAYIEAVLFPDLRGPDAGV